MFARNQFVGLSIALVTAVFLLSSGCGMDAPTRSDDSSIISVFPGAAKPAVKSCDASSVPARTGAAEVETLGYDFFGDSVYHLYYTFEHSAPSLAMDFVSSGELDWRGRNDESWGLDNVTIRANGLVVYSNDFESAVGPEWSTQATEVTPEGSRTFLGRFIHDEEAILTLANLPPHTQVSIDCDLYIIQSWDGCYDPDTWMIRADGQTLMSATFSNVHDAECPQSYCPDELSELGDFVWEDLDGDGIQDVGEPGVPGVTVNLYDCSTPATLLATGATGDYGYYLFQDLPPGCYVVEFLPPNGFGFSPQNQGGDNGADSDASPLTGRTGPIDLGPNVSDRSWDAGLVGGLECGKCEGKVKGLTLRYDGTVQGLVTVIEKDKAVVFNDYVSPGQAFSFVGKDKKGTLGTEITIEIDGVADTKIHTSCSQPIGPGLISGNFEVIAGESLKGGPLCPVDNPDGSGGGSGCGCDGKVTDLVLQYNGAVGDYLTVRQKKGGVVVFDGNVQPGEQFSFSGQDKKGTLGTEIILSINGTETRIHTSCSQPIGPGLVRGDFEVVSGRSRVGGELCPVDYPGDPGSPSDDCECKGKVTDLTLQYIGTLADAHVVVAQKKGGLVVFDGIVQPQGQFSVTGADKKGTLGTDILIDVNGQRNTKIHTSCSQPIGPGLVSGDFMVLAGESLNGGPLCPL